MPKTPKTKPDSQLDAKVARLRELLISAKDLDEVSEYFHDVLVPDEAFIQSSERASNPRLLTVLPALLARVEPEGRLGIPLMLRLEHQAVVHGYSTWGRGHVVFFYFEQLDLGFCSYSPSLTSIKVTFVRFNLANVTGCNHWPCWQSGSSKARQTPQ